MGTVRTGSGDEAEVSKGRESGQGGTPVLTSEWDSDRA